MANWVVTLTRNNLDLTKRAIESFRAQDIGDVKILVVENDSSDNTANFLATQPDLTVIYNKPQAGVAGGWNQALRWLMNPKWRTDVKPPMPMPPMCEYVLVCNNDVILRPDTFRHLVADGGGFVTAVGTRDPEKIKPVHMLSMPLSDFAKVMYGGSVIASEGSRLEYLPPDPSSKRPHPDMSCYLIRRHVWETVGEFDENFIGGYGEDGDIHLRMHRAGITAWALELPFLHYGAQTVTNADQNERKRIQKQADLNRDYFAKKYGFRMGSDEYYAAFGTGRPPDDVPSL